MADEVLNDILTAEPTDDFRRSFLDLFEVSAQQIVFSLFALKMRILSSAIENKKKLINIGLSGHYRTSFQRFGAHQLTEKPFHIQKSLIFAGIICRCCINLFRFLARMYSFIFRNCPTNCRRRNVIWWVSCVGQLQRNVNLVHMVLPLHNA